MDAQLPIVVNSTPAPRTTADTKSVKSSTAQTPSGNKKKGFSDVMADVTSPIDEAADETQQAGGLIAGLNSGIAALLMQMQAVSLEQAPIDPQTANSQQDGSRSVAVAGTGQLAGLSTGLLAGNAKNAAQLPTQLQNAPTATVTPSTTPATDGNTVIGVQTQNVSLANLIGQAATTTSNSMAGVQQNQPLAGSNEQDTATVLQTTLPDNALVSKQAVRVSTDGAQAAPAAATIQNAGVVQNPGNQQTDKTDAAKEDSDSVLVPVASTKTQVNTESLQQQTKNDAGLFSQAKETVQTDTADKAQPSEIGQNVFASILEHRSNVTTQAPALAAEQPAPQTPYADTHNIGAQIVDKVQLVKSAENSQIVIQLKPEHLGELSLKVAVNNGVVSASFHSDNPEVRSIIEASINQLKQEFSNQGLKVDNVGIYAGLGQFLSEGQQRETAQYPTVKIRNKKAEEEAFQELDAIEGPVANDATDSGVDYRV